MTNHGLDNNDKYEVLSDHDARRRQLLFAATAIGAGVLTSPALANTLNPVGLSASTNVNGRFAGKTILVTGGTSGIGKTTVEAFAREGAHVFFNGRRQALGRDVEAAVVKSGGKANYISADVREPDQVRRFIGEAASRTGRVDVLYNNAGIFMTPGEVQDIAIENYHDIMSTNAGGVFYGMKYVIPQMRSQGGGVIINMASVAGHKGFPNTAAYNASKHAIIGMTKAAAIANAKHNIRINSISPLAVDTPQLRESFSYQKLTYEQVAPAFVTPRIMTTDEIARIVMFLASDDATSIAATDIDVTGGQLA